MPLDHYVSQVHLANFTDTGSSDGRLFGIKKNDLSVFRCRTKDVCRTSDGSTNQYLEEPRIIEEFLRTIEPVYNKSVNALIDGAPTPNDIYAIAGFIAYVNSCSPTAMRLHSEILRVQVDATGRVAEKRGILPPPPDILGASSFSELIDKGIINIVIDQKYPQAMGISSIMRTLTQLGNSHWELIHNNKDYSPFLTSDYPIAIEPTSDPRICRKIVPLRPDLAVCITPIQGELHSEVSFPHFQLSRRNANFSRVRSVNELIVRCAEKLIFCAAMNEWTQRFISKNQNYRLKVYADRIPLDGGQMIFCRIGTCLDR